MGELENIGMPVNGESKANTCSNHPLLMEGIGRTFDELKQKASTNAEGIVRLTASANETKVALTSMEGKLDTALEFHSRLEEAQREMEHDLKTLTKSCQEFLTRLEVHEAGDKNTLMRINLTEEAVKKIQKDDEEQLKQRANMGGEDCPPSNFSWKKKTGYLGVGGISIYGVVELIKELIKAFNT